MNAPRAVGSALVLVLSFAGCDAGDDDGPAVPAASGVRWETLAPMPSARSEVAAATDGQRIVVAGGFDASGDTVASVDVLDLATTTWSRGPDLPIAVNHPMAAAVGGTIVVLGGYLETLENPTDRAFALGDGGWGELPPMPSPRAAGGAAEVDGRLFLAGGVGPDGALVEDVVVFDPDTRAWTVHAGPPTAREHLGVAGHDGELFVVGGRTGGIGANLDAAEALDVAAGSWRELVPMPTARGGSAATATSNGYVVSAGGEADATFDEAEAYDVRAERWVALPVMQTARHGLGVVAVGTMVYVVAGGTEPGLSVSDVVETIDLSPLRSAEVATGG